MANKEIGIGTFIFIHHIQNIIISRVQQLDNDIQNFLNFTIFQTALFSNDQTTSKIVILPL